jgi:putative FmdB family regulatory protein
MPTYVYRCEKCGDEFEFVQSFEDSPVAACPNCGGTLKRLLFPPAIIFKGSGWYCTDNRSPSGGGNGGSPKAAEKAEEKTADESVTSTSASGEDGERDPDGE